MRLRISRALAFVAPATLVMVATSARAQWTALIEEQTDYSVCGGISLNTITADLPAKLDDLGHNTYRLTGLAWPQDWTEHCNPPGALQYGNGDGMDLYWADDASFSVYAGHGFLGEIDFGQPHSGVCNVKLGRDMRLGQMDHGVERAGTVWYLSSCTMNLNNLVSDVNFQWVHQQAGFHNSAQISTFMVDETFDATTGSNPWPWPSYLSNEQAWNWMMSAYGNSSIVVSYGETAAQALDVDQHATVGGDNYVFNGRPAGPSCGNGPPLFYYYYSWVNQGGCP